MAIHNNTQKNTNTAFQRAYERLKAFCNNMALIKCTECGQTVSDKAEKCPKCGCLLKNERKQMVGYAQRNIPNMSKDDSSFTFKEALNGVWHKLFVTSCILLLFVGIYDLFVNALLPFIYVAIDETESFPLILREGIINVIYAAIYNIALICIVYVISKTVRKKGVQAISVILCCIAFVIVEIRNVVQPLNGNMVFLLNIVVFLLRIVAFLIMLGQLRGTMVWCIILLLIPMLLRLIHMIDGLAFSYDLLTYDFYITIGGVLSLFSYITAIIASIFLLYNAHKCNKLNGKVNY